MKRLLLSLGLVAITASSVNSIVSIKCSSKVIENNNQVSNYEQYKTELVTVMNLKISIDNEEKIKEIILNSLFLVNDQVYVNTNLFDNIQDYQMKALFSNVNFQKIIQNMYENKVLIKNNEDKLIFIDFKVQSQSSGVWAESHWYWFGYWKLHFDHATSRNMTFILDAASGATDIAYEIAGMYPWTGIMLGGFSAFCFVNSFIFDSYDHGNGVWIGWYIIIPDMGWGSN